MPHPTRAEARALVRARRQQEEERDLQSKVYLLLNRIRAANQSPRLPAAVDELIGLCNLLIVLDKPIWVYFQRVDEDTAALIAQLVAPRLAAMTPGCVYRRHKFARA